MGNDLDLPEMRTIFALLRIYDRHQAPVGKQGGDGIPSLHVIHGQIRWLSIEKEQLLEMNDEVPALLVQDVARLVELIAVFL